VYRLVKDGRAGSFIFHPPRYLELLKQCVLEEPYLDNEVRLIYLRCIEGHVWVAAKALFFFLQESPILRKWVWVTPWQGNPCERAPLPVALATLVPAHRTNKDSAAKTQEFQRHGQTIRRSRTKCRTRDAKNQKSRVAAFGSEMAARPFPYVLLDYDPLSP
jgi:hypothetical protein